MSERLLKESDVLRMAFQLPFVVNSAFADAVKALPSANRPQKVIAQITFDEEKLHEIVKEAVERFKEEYEIIDRPQGEWIYGEHDVAMCDGYRCDRCGFFVPWDYKHKSIDFINDYNYCPNCGVRMKGAVDETTT